MPDGFALPSLPVSNTPSLNFQLPDLHLPNAPAVPFLHPASLPAPNIAPPAFANIWGIYDASGNKLFDVDTCLSADFKDPSKVSEFPVEDGSFTTYNKVKEPLDAKIRLGVAGMKKIAVALTALRAAVASVNLYDIWTPEYIYQNCTVVIGSYKRTEKEGRNLLEVLIDLKEVRQVGTQYATSVPITSKKALKSSSSSKVSSGKAQTATPTPSLQNMTTSQVAALAKQQAAKVFGG
jgi:hypothetical protein